MPIPLADCSSSCDKAVSTSVASSTVHSVTYAMSSPIISALPFFVPPSVSVSDEPSRSVLVLLLASPTMRVG